MSQSRLLVSVPDSHLRDALAPLPHGVEVIVWDMTTPAPVRAIDIVVTNYLQQLRTLANVNGVAVRLVQSQSIGYDHVAEVLGPGYVFANAASVHESSTAELAMALILASQRGIPQFVRDAVAGHWSFEWYPSLADRHVLLVGAGGISRALEDRLAGFEVTVERVARRAREDERGPVHGLDKLPELLSRADVVVVAVPLTSQTTRMINADFLRAMKDGALLVNVSRGPVADTDAVLEAAQSGRLRFGLDVTDPEPLPDNHPLFGLANVLISPHVGGASSAMGPRIARLIREQIDLMRDGREPRNVVLRT